MDADLNDRIYESAFVPELWPGVLDDLSSHADARGGVLLVTNAKAGVLRWTASETIADLVNEFVAGGWLSQGQRVAVLSDPDHEGFNGEHSSDEELDAQPMYRDFLHPRGFGYAAGTGIRLPTGDFVFLSVERARVRGRVELDILSDLNGIRPHLARSALLSARLQLDRAQAVSETLAILGLPAIVFDVDGRVLGASSLVEAQSAHIRWRARDQVGLNDKDADALFRNAVLTIGAEDAPQVRSFAVRDLARVPILVAHVVPIRRSARDLFVRGAGVLVLTPITLPNAPPVELIRSLFDLTPAEARVARGLAAGDSVDDLARTAAVSRNTIRTHVRGVLEKTGCTRQGQIIALLGGIQTPAI